MLINYYIFVDTIVINVLIILVWILSGALAEGLKTMRIQTHTLLLTVDWSFFFFFFFFWGGGCCFVFLLIFVVVVVVVVVVLIPVGISTQNQDRSEAYVLDYKPIQNKIKTIKSFQRQQYRCTLFFLTVRTLDVTG